MSRKPARPGGRGGDAGRAAGYDEYDQYAEDGYQRNDDAWSASEYFSPEGIKGRWAGEHPEGRAGGRGPRDDGRGGSGAGYDSDPGGFDDAGYRTGGQPDAPRDGARRDSAPRDGAAGNGALRDGSVRGAAPRGDSAARGEMPRSGAPRGTGYGSPTADEYASGAYDLPDGAEAEPAQQPRRRRREERTGWTGALRLRRDRGEDLWPDDGISDEDYWASVAADRPLTGPSGEGRGPQARPGPSRTDEAAGDGPRFSAGQSGPDQRRGSQPGPGQRSGAGRLGPPPGLASDYQPGGASRRPGTGPNAARPSTGPTPRVGVTASRPPTGPHSARPAAASAAGTIRGNGGWNDHQQAAGRPSGGLGQPPARPSFQPNGNQAATTPAASRAQDRGDWGERTERIERVTASGYPDQRTSSREPGSAAGTGTGASPALRPGGPATARPPVPSGPRHGRGETTGRDDSRTEARRADSGFRPAPGRPDGGREAGSREAGNSIWSVPAGEGAPGQRQDDPLTSTAYSRSANAETDGRSYRVAARRSQAQATLTDQTETLVTAQYQQSSYPGYGTQPGAEPPTGGYETTGRPAQPRPPQPGQPQAQQAAGPLSAPVANGTRPAAPPGRNPYDSGTSSYPYPSSQSYPATPGSPPAADGSAGRYYQPQAGGGSPDDAEPRRGDQPASDQGKPGYQVGYSTGRRPY